MHSAPAWANEQLEVVVAAPDAPAAALRDLVAEVSAASSLRLQFRRVARIRAADVIRASREPQVFGRFWIDASESARVTLILVDGATTRVLVRVLAAQAESQAADGRAPIDEVLLEEIGFILERAIDALKAGDPLGVAPEEAVLPETLDEPPAAVVESNLRSAPAPRERTYDERIRAGVSLQARGELWAGTVTSQLGAGVFVAPSGPLQLFLVGAYRFPATLVDGPVRVVERGGSAVAGVDGLLFGSDGFGLGLSAGLGTDLRQPSLAPGPGVRSFGSRTSFEPFLRLGARLSATMLPQWSLVLRADLDWLLHRTTYTLTAAEGTETLYTSPRWRPSIGLGIEWVPF